MFSRTAIPSLRPPGLAPIRDDGYTAVPGSEVPDVDAAEALLAAVEPLLLGFTLAGYRPRSIGVVGGSAHPTDAAVDLSSWWLRATEHFGVPIDPPGIGPGTPYVALRLDLAPALRLHAPNVPPDNRVLDLAFLTAGAGLVEGAGDLFVEDDADAPPVVVLDASFHTIDESTPIGGRWIVWAASGSESLAGVVRSTAGALCRRLIGTGVGPGLAAAADRAGLLRIHQPEVGPPVPGTIDAVLARVWAVAGAPSTSERAAFLRSECACAVDGDPISPALTNARSAHDVIVAANPDAGQASADLMQLLQVGGTVAASTGVSTPGLEFSDLVQRSWTWVLLRLEELGEIDLLARYLPAGFGWDTSDFRDNVHDWLSGVGSDWAVSRELLERRAAELVDTMSDRQIGMLPTAMVDAWACLQGLTKSEILLVLEIWSALEADVMVPPLDSCSISRLARFGICVMRHGLFMLDSPDVFEAWLDGRSAIPGALSAETFTFPPDARGEPTEVRFQPISHLLAVEQHRDRIAHVLAMTTTPVIWAGAMERLRAGPGAVRPRTGPVLANVRVGEGVSPLASGGIDHLYHQAPIRYTPLIQAFPNHIADYDLYPIGGVTLVSEVELSAVPATTEIVGVGPTPGWNVTIMGWRVRVVDVFDFNPNDTQSIPLGSAERGIEVRDSDIIRLYESPCPGAPVPADLVVVSDEWVHFAPESVSDVTVFVSQTTIDVPDGPSSPFGTPTTPFDLFRVDGTGIGINGYFTPPLPEGFAVLVLRTEPTTPAEVAAR